MRAPSIIIVVSVVAAGLLGAPAQAATDLSGSLSYAGHTITWSAVGVAPATGDLVGRYDAVVTAGQTVTFSGSAAYTQRNAVTNLRQEAYLTNVTPDPGQFRCARQRRNLHAAVLPVLHPGAGDWECDRGGNPDPDACGHDAARRGQGQPLRRQPPICEHSGHP